MKLLTKNINSEYIESIKEKYPFSLHGEKIQDGDFIVKSSYAGEIRMGPPYFYVKVEKNNSVIWKSDSIHGGELFFKNILSERFKKLILVKWFSTMDPSQQTIVMIDLENGIEKEIVERQRYYWAGHFHSFDGIFYSDSNKDDIRCRDLENNSDFLLFERIKEKISNPISWSISDIDNTIIVFTNDTYDNVFLFDIRKKEIIDSLKMPMELSQNGKIYSFLDKDNGKLLIELKDYDLTSENRIINNRKTYNVIDFKN